MSNRESPKIKRIKTWCPICDSAILTGTICLNCNADTSNTKLKGKIKIKPKRIKQEQEEED